MMRPFISSLGRYSVSCDFGTYLMLREMAMAINPRTRTPPSLLDPASMVMSILTSSDFCERDGLWLRWRSCSRRVLALGVALRGRYLAVSSSSLHASVRAWPSRCSRVSFAERGVSGV